MPYWLDEPAAGDDTGELWCPFNLFRTSADVSANFASVMHNLWSTAPFQASQKPLSQPGCWAYPE